MEIVSKLHEKVYTLGVHDPQISQAQVECNLSAFDEAIDGANIMLVLTDHNEFKILDDEAIMTKAKLPLILDTKKLCGKIHTSRIEFVNFETLRRVGEKDI